MAKGNLVKRDNLIKWTLQAGDACDTTEVSESFEIQDCKFTFLFYYGYDVSPPIPISLSIKINGNEKLTCPIDVIILVSSNSNRLTCEKHVVTGEHEQKIWSSFNYTGIRKTLLVFEMVIYNADIVLKDDKSVQTFPYMDSSLLFEDLSKDLDKLFQEGLDYDVEFICGEETIKAHKNILCTRSNVFASMLHSDMKEGKIGQVKIEDMESDILRQFLRCLYTGKLSELTVDKALLFYQASDKYAVDALKKQCINYLVDNVSPENACGLLVMADRHSDPDFKKNIIEYMIRVEVPIIGEKWTDFCKENSFLATEVLNIYCQHLRQK